MYLLLKDSKPANTILEYLKNKLDQAIKPEKEYNNEFIKKYIKESVYIFGAGKIGREIQTLLDGFNISIAGFIDNDIKKQGGGIKGIRVYSLAEVRKDAMVIVAVVHDTDIITQLKNGKYKNVILHGEFRRQSFKLLPSKIEL